MSNSSVIVMTAAKAKPGREQELHRALRDVAQAARRQAGCVDYRIFRSAEDVGATLNVEQWTSEEERNASLAGPEVETFIAAVSDIFAGAPEPISYQEID